MPGLFHPLQVLEAYTTGFDFAHLKFDSALRMFLESFKLPGEAQKIDRIINAFGRHYYAGNEDVFRCADAAYVLAYSVIMLNTDQHNNQVRGQQCSDLCLLTGGTGSFRGNTCVMSTAVVPVCVHTGQEQDDSRVVPAQPSRCQRRHRL